MKRRCARLWFLRGLYVGVVAGQQASRWDLRDLIHNARWMLRFWRDLYPRRRSRSLDTEVKT